MSLADNTQHFSEDQALQKFGYQQEFRFSVLLSGIVGFAFLVALNLASGNLSALTASSTPVADIVTGTLGNVVGKIFLVLVTFSIFACGLVLFITVSRLVWAMSRDQRFPGYHVFRRVNKTTGTPVAATLLSGILIEVVLAAFAGWGGGAKSTRYH